MIAVAVRVDGSSSVYIADEKPLVGPFIRGRCRVKGSRTVGLDDALMLHMNNEICDKHCGGEVRCKAFGLKNDKCPNNINSMFNTKTWKDDSSKLEHEIAGRQGSKIGGHVIYMMRKCKELSLSGDFDDCEFGIPEYDAHPESQYQIFFQKVLVPLRAEMQDKLNQQYQNDKTVVVSRKRPYLLEENCAAQSMLVLQTKEKVFAPHAPTTKGSEPCLIGSH